MKTVRVESRRCTRRVFLSLSAGSAIYLGLGSAEASRVSSQPAPRVNQTRPGFEKDFFWGAATSAYQIEGAAHEDGKGPSVWDEFCKKPGAIWQGQSGDVACDHYHRYKEDVGNMKAMGLSAYRFSISWPRVLPEGVGKVNEKGLDFYSRLVDELLRAGVMPFITLFHWDYPVALHQRGGWMNRDSADWFAEYVTVVVRSLSDRVTHWLTINEPQSLLGGGYYVGVHAPGEKRSLKDVLGAGHVVLLAHGKAVQAIRANSKRPSQVGYAPVGVPGLPVTESAEDVAAARTFTFSLIGRQFERGDGWWANNTWWMDAVFLGKYPADGLAVVGKDAPEITAGDMETIHQPLDFFAVNTYEGVPIRAGADGKPEYAPWPAGTALTATDWFVTPSALYWGPKWYYERYGKPIFVTENGVSLRDWVSIDGQVHDLERIDFTTRYLRSLHRAASEGVPIRGYFQWSLMDNFEWDHGFKERFGMIFVDYPTQKRILKDSARWYARLSASNGAALFEEKPG